MKNIRNIFIITILMISINQVYGQMSFNNSPIKNVSATEAQQLLEKGDFVILDIRTPMEFNASKIEGAINIDFYKSNFKNELNKLDKEKAYFVYCRSGNRTGQSMKVFQSLGFNDIVHLYKGIIDWTGSGYKMH